MADKTWKAVERRVCKLLGGERRGPMGKDLSDCTDEVPWAVEIKWAKRYSLQRSWLDQAQRHAAEEKKPWLLVVAEHGDRDPIVCMRLTTFLDVARNADQIPWTAPKEEAA